MVKPRYSAFDHTPVRLILAGRGIQRIALSGTATERCVAQTAIDARQVGLKVTAITASPRTPPLPKAHSAGVVGTSVLPQGRAAPD